MSNSISDNFFYTPAADVPKGTLAIKIGNDHYLAGYVFQGTDVSETTATPQKVLSGELFYTSAGVLVQGSIPVVSAVLSANTVTVPKGYISDSQTLTVQQGGSATVTDNKVHIPSGYRSSSDSLTVGTSIGAATITPTTSNQVLSAGLYLGGAQTILGDVNLIADNIASGVSIFGVQGTHQGSQGVQLEAGVLVQENGVLKVQPLKFDGTIASDSGSTQNFSLKIFNTGKDEPDYAVGGISDSGSQSQGGSSGTIDFYRCTSVQQPQTSSVYIVSGAGMNAVNGTYVPYGTYGGRPSYKQLNGDYAIGYWDGPGYYMIITFANLEQGSVVMGNAYYAVSGTDLTSSGWDTINGTSPAPTITASTVTTGDKTWSGQKAVFNGTYYEFQSNSTEGLPYDTITPQVGNTYSSDLLIQAVLYTGQ